MAIAALKQTRCQVSKRIHCFMQKKRETPLKKKTKVKTFKMSLLLQFCIENTLSQWEGSMPIETGCKKRMLSCCCSFHFHWQLRSEQKSTVGAYCYPSWVIVFLFYSQEPRGVGVSQQSAWKYNSCKRISFLLPNEKQASINLSFWFLNHIREFFFQTKGGLPLVVLSFT